MIKYGTDIKEMYKHKVYNKKIDVSSAIKELREKHNIECTKEDLLK